MAESTIDAQTFKDLQDNAGEEFVIELIDTFLEEAPQMLTELREGFAAGDADRFRRAAHSLKSNANTFGALTFGAMARDLELQGLDAARAVGPEALDTIKHEYVRVAAALKRLRDA
jgi:HPt (histidine-containing phosphotransfer) domain-containing protein